MLRFTITFAIWFATTAFCQAKEIVLLDLQGRQILFSSLHGKWVFINYWASWCHPCVNEIATFNRFYAMQNEKVALFAVNYDHLPLNEQHAMVEKYHIHYPSLQTDPSRILNLGDILGVPATFVFNPQGAFCKVLYGEQTLTALTKLIS